MASWPSMVLGVATGPSEAEVFWTEFLRSLADRGLRGVQLVIAAKPARGAGGGPNDHKGLRAAARRVFDAGLQRCRVPAAACWPPLLRSRIARPTGARWARNVLAHAGPKQRAAVAAIPRGPHEAVLRGVGIKTIFAQETREEAYAQWNKVADALREKNPALGDLLDASREDVLTYMDYPKDHWPQIASTTPWKD